MKSRILDKVAVNGCGNGGNITDMLHHGSDSDGCHCKDCSDIKFTEEEFWNTHNWCASYASKAEDCTSVCVCHAKGIHNQGYYIGNHNPHQDRNDTEHSNAPDIEENNSSKCDQGKDPVLGGIADRRWCQAKTDTDNNGTGYNWRQITHNAFYTDNLNDHGQYQVQKSCYKHTAACVWKLLSIRHVCKDSGIQFCNCGETTKECK